MFVGLIGDAEFAEKPREIRISDFVENHEAGVNRHGAIFFSDGNRIRVAARVIVFFVKRQVELAMQKMRAAQTGNAGSNDGDPFHARCEWLAERFFPVRIGWSFS